MGRNAFVKKINHLQKFIRILVISGFPIFINVEFSTIFTITFREGEMTESKTEEVQPISLQNKLQLSFLGTLSISFIGYFALREHWIGFIFAHVAAVSIMGFFGCLAGAIAQKKGYRYSRAFQIGFFTPIMVGAIAAFLIVPPGRSALPLTCGGWFSLLAGISIVIAYVLIRSKTTQQT
jgi:hypothetical protein